MTNVADSILAVLVTQPCGSLVDNNVRLVLVDTISLELFQIHVQNIVQVVQGSIGVRNLDTDSHDFTLDESGMSNVGVILVAKVGLHFAIQGHIFIDLVGADSFDVDGSQRRVGSQINVDRHIGFVEVDTFCWFSTILVHVVDSNTEVDDGCRNIDFHVLRRTSNTLLQDVDINLVFLATDNIVLETDDNCRPKPGSCSHLGATHA